MWEMTLSAASMSDILEGDETLAHWKLILFPKSPVNHLSGISALVPTERWLIGEICSSFTCAIAETVIQLQW